MKYVAGLDFETYIPYYIRVNKDGSWDEIYTPNCVTVFSSKAKAIKWVKENTTFGEYACAEKLEDAQNKFQEWMSNGMVRRSFDPVNKKISRVYNNESPDEIFQWWLDFNKENENIRHEDYRTWPRLYDVFECISGICRYTDDTITFSFRVKKDTKFNVFKKELNKVLPYITHEDDKGNKIIDIFDRFCGEGGNFVYFYIYNDGTYGIHDRWSGLTGKLSLEEVFDFWKTERYYE